MIESEKTEFKREYTDRIINEIIAFANSKGGKILIGVDDNGKITGLENVDECYTKITNSVRDSILPDITMFLKYTVNEDDRTIEISVSEGTNKPYFIKSKGMRPEGVYVRQGSSSAPASVEKIREMIKLSENDIFENARALNQELHFTEASHEFKHKNIEFNENKFQTLGIKNSDDLYTNLGVLLSDECKHTIKAAVFSGNDKKIFKDRKEFAGSLFKQLRSCFDFLELCNHTEATFNGLDRIEKQDYPSSALREAILNAIVHRDYSFSGSIMINIFDDKIEFVSLGGLISGLTKADILRGVSQTRNEKLANIFYRLKHIEAYGTGIQRIFDLYSENPVKPDIIITDNTFTMVLPKMYYESDVNIYNPSVEFTWQEQAVINFLKKNNSISAKELQELLKVKRSRTYAIIKSMSEKGIITTIGKGADKKYGLK